MSAELDVVVLRCADLDATLAFYERLGLEFAEEQHGRGPRHFSTQLGAAVLELYPATDRFPIDQAPSASSRTGHCQVDR